MIPVPYILLYSYLRSIYYFRMRINLTVSLFIDFALLIKISRLKVDSIQKFYA
jgi:hypothetical protein